MKRREMMTPEETQKMLSRLFHHEVDKQAANRASRQQGLRAVMSEQEPYDDLPEERQWIAGIVVNDLHKQTTWMAGQARRRDLSVLVSARGMHNMPARLAAAKRMLQIRAGMDAMDFGTKAALAFEDAAMSGEGFVGTELNTSADGSRLVLGASFLPWQGEFADSQVIDDDRRRANLHFSVRWVDISMMKLMFPKQKSLLEDHEVGAPSGTAPIQYGAGRWGAWGGHFGLPWTLTGNEEYDGWSERGGCWYAKCWWREPVRGKDKRTGKMREMWQLFTAPALLARGKMELELLAAPSEEKTQMIPRFGIVAARHPRTREVFSPLVKFTEGLDRALQGGVRAEISSAVEQKVVVSTAAIPKKSESNNELLITPDDFVAQVREFASGNQGTLYVEDMNGIQVVPGNDRAQSARHLIDSLLKYKEISSPVHAALQGQGGQTAPAGVALRELADLAVNSEHRAYGTHLSTFRDCGEWMLTRINRAERFMDFGPNMDSRGGRGEYMTEEMLNLELSESDLANFRLGVNVRAVDRSSLINQEEATIFQKILEMNPGNPNVVLAVMQGMFPLMPMVNTIAESYVKQGFPVMDEFLRDDQIARRDKMQEGAEAERRRVQDLEELGQRSDAFQKFAKGMAEMAKSGATVREMEQAAIDFDGKLNAGSGQGGGESKDLLTALAEARRAKQPGMAIPPQ